jgi:GNAT superfamily N-acetyltransferase
VIVRLLQPADDRSAFSCGDPDYDDFLRKYAGQNQFVHRVGNTVVAVEDERVIAYATFAVGEVSVDTLPDDAAHRLPRYPCPVVRLARLAVDTRYQGQGIGSYLVSEVLGVGLRVRAEFGCVAVVVDAMTTRQDFYTTLGFGPMMVVQGRPRVSGTVPMFLMLSHVEEAERRPE